MASRIASYDDVASSGFMGRGSPNLLSAQAHTMRHNEKKAEFLHDSYRVFFVVVRTSLEQNAGDLA